MLPLFQCDSAYLLCYRCVNETDRWALVLNAGLSCPHGNVAMEQPVGLVIGESRRILRLIYGEYPNFQLMNRLKRHRFVACLFCHLSPGIAAYGKIEPAGIHYSPHDWR